MVIVVVGREKSQLETVEHQRLTVRPRVSNARKENVAGMRVLGQLFRYRDLLRPLVNAQPIPHSEFRFVGCVRNSQRQRHQRGKQKLMPYTCEGGQ